MKCKLKIRKKWIGNVICKWRMNCSGSWTRRSLILPRGSWIWTQNQVNKCNTWNYNNSLSPCSQCPIPNISKTCWALNISLAMQIVWAGFCQLSLRKLAVLTIKMLWFKIVKNRFKRKVPHRWNIHKRIT